MKTAIGSKQQLQKETLDGQLLILRHLKAKILLQNHRKKSPLMVGI